MKVFWMLVAAIFLVGGFALFAFAFQADQIFLGAVETESPLKLLMFFGGILAVSIAYMIPFHLLEKFD